MKSLTPLLAAGVACLLVQNAQATLLYSEGFVYPTGALSGNDSWLGGATGLTVGSGNLTYSGLDDLGGNELLDSQGTAGTMTVNFSASPITSGSIYYSFLIQASSLPTGNNYLTSLLPVGGTPNGGTDPLAFYVGQQTAGSTYKIGIRHAGLGSGATYTTGAWATVGTINLVVVKYTFVAGTGNDTLSLYVNPTPGGTEPLTPDVSLTAAGTDAASLQTMGFKAQGNATTGNWVFDTLRIGDTWGDVTPSTVPEPSTFALAGLGFALIAARRKLC